MWQFQHNRVSELISSSGQNDATVQTEVANLWSLHRHQARTILDAAFVLSSFQADVKNIRYFQVCKWKTFHPGCASGYTSTS